MIRISDGNNHAEISLLGAELRSLNLGGRELLWKGDPAVWGGTAMVLFPFIGRCCSDSYLYEGKRYTMGLHGFAWKKVFRVVEQTESSCLLELRDDPQTRENYPFSFALQIGFTLREGSLRVRFFVHNRSDKIMPFALGWHPGFALEAGPENYRVAFPENRGAEEVHIVTLCMVTGQETEAALQQGRIPLSREMFLNSARLYRGLGSCAVLENRRGEPLVTMEYPGFPITTLWQTLGSGAEFICIEPWAGRPGKADTVEALEEGKISLPPREVFVREVRITGKS